MTMTPSEVKSDFAARLSELKHRFDALKPELELVVRDPDMGVEGYVVVWNTLASVGGPLGRVGKGGTRITPDVSLDEIRMLARIMTLKNAAAGLPLGGAKSGLVGDPDAPGFEAKYRRFVELVKPILRENGGIFGGFGFDLGARPEHALWACDVLHSRQSFTGKPLSMGGTDYDNEGVAGLGVETAAEVLLQEDGIDLSQASCAVQGLGAMGAAIIRYASENGIKVVAFSDPRIGGTVLVPDGLTKDLQDAIVARDFDRTNSCIKTGNYAIRPLEDVMYLDTTVFFPAARQDVIDGTNVSRVAAKYVVEGANNPVSEEARTYLHEHGIKLVPDFIANPGGIVAAFVELTSTADPEENVKSRVNVSEAKRMTVDNVSKNVREMCRLVQEHGVEPSDAGMYLALSAIFKDR